MSDFFDNIIIKAFTKNKKGYLIINEYVGKSRLQYSGSQISAINTAIKKIPKSFRQIYKTNIFKNRYYGSGVLRMIIADPSECVDSESILPEIHKRFETIIEKPYGGNLLMSALKDIAHHFIDLSDEKSKVLQHLFDLEDEYLKSHQSDFVFGIYEFKND
ncbi:hypothetical protein ASG01_09860 [Chryseobacterium sp. Leaf180]|uniref:hypothetical protein n=1 Tax=Chryseobacterium sp. Leaf180 TaxID=1736289 RepID=UPI0006F56394|nr:hypothetical protein [Chryseobacterium sp. Leaf180]KQR93477.1 hypothetical protein ASG01_09860 [Chryseobacterium sp. Leaf180]